MAAQLNREGIGCSVGLVAELMREAGLRGRKRTTIPGEDEAHPARREPAG